MQDIDRKLLKKNRFSDGYSVRIYPWDFVWAAAMGVMFALCLELFYRMAVNYNHKYPSDLYYYAVQNPRTHDEKGRFIGKLFEFFYNINEEVFEAAVFLAFLMVGIIIANYLVIYYFVRDDGYINKVPRYSMQFFSMAAIFMGTIYVPVILER